MSLILTEEQQLLQKTARDFVTANAPVTKLRELRDRKDDSGFSRPLWKQMAELGWTGLIEAEEHGGSALGYAELGVLLEECGRTLTPTPFLSTLLLGGGCVRQGGSEALRKQILTGVARGETLLALALDEAPHFAPYAIATSATRQDDGYAISGEKTFVLDGHVADHLVVVTRTSGASGERDGLTCFLLDPGTPGLTVTRTVMVDSRNAARVTLDRVAAGTAQVLGEIDQGADLLDPVLDRATAGLCAEMLGLMSEAFDRTIEYLKTREQFGVKIGSFQGLKHRAAAMFAELELSRAIVLDTLHAIDEQRPEVPTLVSTAKARCSDAAGLITREGIQMHGGIGMTDEEEIGFFLKRARAAELTLGDSRYHRERFATLQGY
jgi:alkylation response protein AidB-like acyl-CoA dehydrogenase